MIIREQEVEILSSPLIMWDSAGKARFSYDEGEKLTEFAGRICYKSENRMTAESWKEFLRRRKEEGHSSIFEHHWEIRKYNDVDDGLSIAVGSPFLFRKGPYISGNVLAFERDFPGYLERTHLVPEQEIRHVFLSDIKKFAKLIPLSVRFVTNRGITHEMVRHRYPFSYSQESTRYCRYSGDMEFIRPEWLTDAPLGVSITIDNVDDVVTDFWGGVKDKDDSVGKAIGAWFYACLSSEIAYDRFLAAGRIPQEARGVLMNDLKTEIVVTTSVWGWEWMLHRRLDVRAHPQYRELMEELVRICRPFITFTWRA